MASIKPALSELERELKKLLSLAEDIGQIPLSYRRLSAELILLRAYLHFEQFSEQVAAKLASGAKYCDGSSASTVISCKNYGDALKRFRKYDRKKERNLKWSNAKAVRENVEKVFSSGEHYVNHYSAHLSILNEIRFVRNRIAHKGGNATQNYKNVINVLYGSNPKAINPGALLTTSKFKPKKIEEYLNKIRVFSQTLCKS